MDQEVQNIASYRQYLWVVLVSDLLHVELGDLFGCENKRP
jgi:hypothetical protein